MSTVARRGEIPTRSLAKDLAQRTFVPPSYLGWIYNALGKIDSAFDSFEDAVDSSDIWVLDVPVNPASDVLPSHPRYPALLRRMNLAP